MQTTLLKDTTQLFKCMIVTPVQWKACFSHLKLENSILTPAHQFKQSLLILIGIKTTMIWNTFIFHEVVNFDFMPWYNRTAI